MLLDYNSLLLAVGFSAACLSLTLFGTWLTARSDKFLLTWAISVLVIVAEVFVYDAYIEAPGTALGVLTVALLLFGFSVMMGAAYQFRTGHSPLPRIALGAGISFAVALPPMALGYDGLGFMFDNSLAALLLFGTAHEYWKGRAEAPAQLIGVALLYSLTAASFVLCAAVLAWDGKLVLGHAPNNWAEDLSLVIVIASMTGIGALSLALNQGRLARHHQREAQTDALTGLLNRRALFALHGKLPVGAFTAVVVFDLDGFKAINDQHGHAAGDEVLKVFAEELFGNLRPNDVAARMGGEEFALVLKRTLPEMVESTAERIRMAFAARTIETETGRLKCTVSAGFAFGSNEGASFDKVLSAADKALYAAKRGGRNRVLDFRRCA
ncbi:GGDEF domain-containing protein [Mesorhizobium sp. M1C.F.Ca.ET.193.01.1.1]|uniref:GGDEF domain-containing protein n=1 Tax=unclassified Mesorhizobium TaxID=325217 RepID=UPI000FD2B07D|nr:MULTISPECIES: GGDEF domain-containing protein [unclassified Mesorhizobium]TGT03596.1 GGDEF domain-containing protein [bacterium M00.F.Ca.ET.177.01.1.1]TGQ56281.1 GGDEF domain-containing protein [Mesorhizobium sp. M1C.F.Ca.ET.210.01.1.1]TGQ75365.1 GGDEF domain-containing protein [Mesorhizobium sp. M1C.F.Ca.ET.212.01.1.1]TGR13779.1 GGDEF domain-containing protein [Mesorhizobium sp. M1C.F.Ca.ET.204.01.1.1]TGR34053.1 GGDEF domain-containing protein [Mesorhizobium sp. M1C.F.Ca.ET.196.01.1.1]